MQWSIRIYEGGTTFLHGLLWFTGLLFLSGHIAASAVQAGYHLTNVWSHADWIVAMDLGHMGWQELLALASIPSGLLALYSIGTAGRPASISGSAGEDSGAGALRAWLAARSRANARSTSRRDACQLAQMKAPEGAESWTAVRIGVTAPRSKIFIGSCRGRELLTNQI